MGTATRRRRPLQAPSQFARRPALGPPPVSLSAERTAQDFGEAFALCLDSSWLSVGGAPENKTTGQPHQDRTFTACETAQRSLCICSKFKPGLHSARFSLRDRFCVCPGAQVWGVCTKPSPTCAPSAGPGCPSPEILAQWQRTSTNTKPLSNETNQGFNRTSAVQQGLSTQHTKWEHSNRKRRLRCFTRNRSRPNFRPV